MRKMKESGVEWIGEIPCEWDLVQLGSLFKIRNEKVNDTDYAPLSVTRGGIVPQMENVAKSDANDNRKMVLKNDFVINSRSDRKQSCGVSELNGSVSLINTVLYLAEKVPVLPTYLNYLLKNYGFAEEFYRWGHGIVADLWTTRWQEMKSILLPIPSLETQKEILEYLPVATKKTDSLIGNVERQIEKLKAYKQSLITEVVTKGLDKKAKMKDSGVDWIGTIPFHWNLVRLKFLCNKISDGTHFSPQIQSEGKPYITAKDVHGKGIDFASAAKISNEDYDRLVAEGCEVERGDVLLVKDGATTGRVGLVIDDESFVILSSVAMLHPTKKMDSVFLMYLMQSDLIQHQILVSMGGAAMPRTTLTKLVEYKGVLLPFVEQQQIASYLDSKCSQIDRLIEIKQQKIEKLNQYKKSLIYEYVTGKREVA